MRYDTSVEAITHNRKFSPAVDIIYGCFPENWDAILGRKKGEEFLWAIQSFSWHTVDQSVETGGTEGKLTHTDNWGKQWKT